MSSLTLIFCHLFVYLRIFIAYIFGGVVHAYDFKGALYDAAIVIFNSFGSNTLKFNGEPILILIVGVFALGSIIGLIRRLIR